MVALGTDTQCMGGTAGRGEREGGEGEREGGEEGEGMKRLQPIPMIYNQPYSLYQMSYFTESCVLQERKHTHM